MSEEHTDVVEIDAIAVEEWDREQHTPVQVESNLAELVKKSGLDASWTGNAKDEAAVAIDKPRTTTNTMRRTGSAPALPSKVHKTMAMPTVAVKPAPPAAAAAPAQPKAKLEAKTSPAKPATKTTATRAALQPKPATPMSAPPGNVTAKPGATTVAPTAKPGATGVNVAAKLAAAPVDANPAAPVAKSDAVKSVPVAAKPASTKPVKADATPPPAAPIAKSAEVKSAPVAAKPATPAAPIARPAAATATPAPLAAATPTVAPSALELPVWPPAAPRAITSQATPRVEAAPHLAPTPPGHSFDDWDEIGGATSVGNRVRASSQPPRKRGEDSVIVDLDAVSKTERQPSRRPQSYPILTSEQGTTTSGAFVMPIEAQPQAQRAERPTSPAMPVAAASQGAVGSAPHGAPVSSTAWHTPLPLAAPAPEPAPQWPSAAGLEFNSAHGSAPEIPLPVARPEPTEPQLARRTLLATVFPTPTSRKKGLLAAAGAVAVILVIVLVSAGGSAKSAADATAAKPTHATTASSTNVASTTASTSKPAAAAPVAVAAAVPVAAPASTPSATNSANKNSVPPKHRISRGKKPIVVDYDKKPDPIPEQDEALARARTAYAAGNHHLFAGETDAAIVAYRKALADYPTYVAGYRGLGLAFAQQDNKASALDAFKTYVKLAPTAKDVALIKKRIANLSVH